MMQKNFEVFFIFLEVKRIQTTCSLSWYSNLSISTSSSTDVQVWQFNIISFDEFFSICMHMWNNNRIRPDYHCASVQSVAASNAILTGPMPFVAKLLFTSYFRITKKAVVQIQFAFLQYCYYTIDGFYSWNFKFCIET